MKNYKSLFLRMLILLLMLSGKLAAGQFTVVIDPGHGGKDPGALGAIGQEKSINLNVALQVGSLIKQSYPDMKVVYTRTTDKYVTLEERPRIANKADGDLFISIHTNSADTKNAYGAETYTLGLSKSAANFEVAKRENSVLLLEDGNQETYKGFDPTSPESYIMFEFMQSKYIDQSVEIAYYIQQEFVSLKRNDRGVRQAIFWVLHQVKMPSILVELGFISNPNEEKYILSASGQEALSNAIFKGFEKYKHEYDKRTIPAAETNAQTKDEKKEEDSKPNNNKGKDAIIFRLQVFSKRDMVEKNNPEFKKLKGYEPINHTKENGWYKYTCGESTDYEDIVKIKNALKSEFPDAFIVAFKNNKKISIQEALKK